MCLNKYMEPLCYTFTRSIHVLLACRYRRFIVLGTYSKALNMAESMSGGMEADFRHLILKERKKSGGGGKGINDLS
uniref:Uncharacterized protein n=1 Tax=Hucho hucho TaxID=62062 RepID=A0A4W5QTS5_9TELE